MKILNGCSGLGGNSLLWEGHQVDAVEIDKKISDVYKIFRPNDVIFNCDIMEFLRRNYMNYDFIWLSLPCQENTKMVKFTKHKGKPFPDLRTYQCKIFLDHFFEGKYVIENVDPYYQTLIPPTKKIGRHLFWSNFPIGDFQPPKIKNFINKGTVKDSEELKKWLGLEYEGNIYYKGNHDPSQVLRNCVHPKTGKYILDCAMGTMQDYKTNQIDLFDQIKELENKNNMI